MRYITFILAGSAVMSVGLLMTERDLKIAYFLGVVVSVLAMWVCDLLQQYRDLKANQPPIKEKDRRKWYDWLSKNNN